MQIEYFGAAEQRRLAAYHPPGRNSNSPRGMLICAPLGHEYIRTHWALRLLSKQLARKGVHVVRFDYRGHGDSFGNIDQVQSLDQWREDVSDAVDFLKDKSGVPSVAMLGLRSGASLAADVARERSDINSIVAWEPISDGDRFLSELRTVHATMIDLWFHKISTPNDDSCEEILGWCYQRSLLNEMQNWRADIDTLAIPQLLVELSGRNVGKATPASPMQRRLPVDDPKSWDRLCELEAAWLRPKTTRLIVDTIQDLYQRLENNGMLEPQYAGAV